MKVTIIHTERFTGRETIAMTYNYTPANTYHCSCGQIVTMPDNMTRCNCPKCGKRYLKENNEIFPAILLDAAYHDIDE